VTRPLTRLQVVVEGATEEALLKAVLVPHLAERGVYATPMRVLRGGGARGGGSSWQPWERHLRGLLKQDSSRSLRVTTLLDLYAIPGDTPGFDENLRGARRADRILRAMAERLDDDRFVPYVQVHEVEALLFVDLDALTRVDPDVFEQERIAQLAASVAPLTPEEINDRYETAPSRRIQGQFPAFDKVAHVASAAALTGLARIRAGCPRFDAWVTQLESLCSPGGPDG
jgi:hypothetical protein